MQPDPQSTLGLGAVTAAQERTDLLSTLQPTWPSGEDEWSNEERTDPGIARAGAAVAARREKLNITQRSLARHKILNAGALIAFEKGRTWPHRSTRAKLEEVLQWPPGTIDQIRRGGAPATEDTTAVMSNSVQAPLMAQTVELALGTIRATIEDLPTADDATFSRRVNAALSDLRRLERVAANAARTATGAPEVAVALSGVRRTYDQLMLRAARAPEAALGQRLYSARRRAELTVEEMANAAGVPADVIAVAEADGPLSAQAVTALEAVIAALAGR
jgi:transcriptional regulator with XRE-family HTH domain